MVPFLYWQLSGSSWMPSSSFTEWSLPCFNSLWYVYGTSSQAHVLLICLQFYFQAEDDEDEQMDQDDEPQMQVVLHEVRQYCYLSIGFWEWVALSVRVMYQIKLKFKCWISKIKTKAQHFEEMLRDVSKKKAWSWAQKFSWLFWTVNLNKSTSPRFPFVYIWGSQRVAVWDIFAFEAQ